MTKISEVSRRQLIQAGLASVTAVALNACTNIETAPIADEAITLSRTPQCDDHDTETLAQAEGPFYTPSTPERTSLIEAGMVGTVLVVQGQVLTTDCQPVARAVLDFWQANAAGEYDNEGFTLRGHQFTDENGNFELETIVPGLYPGRTRHIHVKVQGPDSDLLTTQLYFPNEAANDRDSIFHPDLLMNVDDDEAGQKMATFNFVI